MKIFKSVNSLNLYDVITVAVNTVSFLPKLRIKSVPVVNLTILLQQPASGLHWNIGLLENVLVEFAQFQKQLIQLKKFISCWI